MHIGTNHFDDHLHDWDPILKTVSLHVEWHGMWAIMVGRRRVVGNNLKNNGIIQLIDGFIPLLLINGIILLIDCIIQLINHIIRLLVSNH